MRKYSATIFSAIVLGFVSVVLEFPTKNMLANLGLPLIIITGIAVLYNFINSIMKKRTTQISRSLMHFGIILILTMNLNHRNIL